MRLEEKGLQANVISHNAATSASDKGQQLGQSALLKESVVQPATLRVTLSRMTEDVKLVEIQVLRKESPPYAPTTRIRR